eukprot:TRINITY_DN7671_c0_g1_i1.p1 TRINITY_DN7671_c0_g1~~TRINITY_DN7671_c0_g1_i1.p1  ORF type:complete len:605 (+),score=132.91 TRINITY_DN7671_c0_g1_i1:31-1845(+)
MLNHEKFLPLPSFAEKVPGSSPARSDARLKTNPLLGSAVDVAFRWQNRICPRSKTNICMSGKLRLVPVDLFSTSRASEKTKEIVVEDELTLGRGPLTGIENDKKVSRKQVQIAHTADGVKATFIGMNASYLFFKNQVDDPVSMRKGFPYSLQEGDIVSLLPTMYAFKLISGDNPPISTPPKAPTSSSNAAAVASPPKPAAQPNEAENEAQRNKRQLENDKSGSEDQKNKKQKLMSDADLAKIREMKEVFPDRSEDDLIVAITETKGDLDRAIEYLLNNPVIQAAPKKPAPSPEEKKERPRSSSNGNDADIAKSLQQAFAEAEEQASKRKKAEDEAKAQEAIIKMLLEEKEAAEKKSADLQKVSVELDRLYLPGEKEALEGAVMKKFDLYPQRSFENDAGTIHFRTAESQFYRLLSPGSKYEVTKVEYIVNPLLYRKFQARRLKLAENMEWQDTKPILCFHGTNDKNIDSIVKNNFDMERIGKNTGNMGVFGKGIYFSESPSYSMGYVGGGTRIMLCQVLIGRSYKTGGCMGASLQKGYDSHISTCGNEIVIYDVDSILPSYIVHYKIPGAVGPPGMPFAFGAPVFAPAPAPAFGAFRFGDYGGY